MHESKSFTVTGMTCEHCRASVIEEVGELPGVERVEVDLATGEMRVRGRSVAEDAVAAAVSEAGYRLAGEGR